MSESNNPENVNITDPGPAMTKEELDEHMKPARELRTHKFVRKPFYVDTVRVSDSNTDLVAEWCKGKIEKTDEGTFIRVDAHRPMTPRQTQAFIGDWVLSTSSGFKVYSPKAFDKTFEKVRHLTKEQADEAGIKPPHEPRPQGEKPKPKPPKHRPKPRVGHVGQALKNAEAKITKTFVQKETGHKATVPADEVEPNKDAEAEAVQKGTDNRETTPDVDYRSAVTGQYVSDETAAANPDTTVAETEQPIDLGKKVEENAEIPKPKKSKADLEAEALIEEVAKLRES